MQNESSDFAQARTSGLGLYPKVRVTLFVGTDYEYETERVLGLSQIEVSKAWDRGRFSPGSINITLDNSDQMLSDNQWPTRIPSALKNVDRTQSYSGGVWYRRYMHDLIKIEYGLMYEGIYRWILQGIYYIEEKEEDYDKQTVTFIAGDIFKLIFNLKIAKTLNAGDIFTDALDDNRVFQFYVKYGEFRQSHYIKDALIPCIANIETQWVPELSLSAPAGTLYKPALENGILDVDLLFFTNPDGEFTRWKILGSKDGYRKSEWPDGDPDDNKPYFEIVYDGHLVKWLYMKEFTPLKFPPVNRQPWEIIQFQNLINEYIKLPTWQFCCNATTVREPIRIYYDFIKNVCKLDTDLIDASAELDNPGNAYDWNRDNAKSFDRAGQLIKNYRVKVDFQKEVDAVELINQLSEILYVTFFCSLDYTLKIRLDQSPIFFASNKSQIGVLRQFKFENMKMQRQFNWVANWVEVHWEYTDKELINVEADATSISQYGKRPYVLNAGRDKNVRITRRETARSIGKRILIQKKEPEQLVKIMADARIINREINDNLRIDDDISGLDDYLEIVSIMKDLNSGKFGFKNRVARNIFPDSDDTLGWFGLDDPNVGLDDHSVNHALW